MPKVSIIIPVYNAEDYLAEAIESVLNQTCRDFELLLVDDRSTDNSLKICEEYRAKDDRITVLENYAEKHGPGPARNIGLEHAVGEFIYFMDADDWIEPDLLEQALNRILEDGSDLVCFGSVFEYYGKQRRSEKTCAFEKQIWTREEIQSNMLAYWKVKSVTLWSHLFKHATIGSLRFVDIPLGEDDDFCSRVVTRVSSISYLNQWLYHYRIRSGSISHQWNPRWMESQMAGWENTRAFLAEMSPLLSETDYTELILMYYLRIVYELALPECPYSFSKKKESMRAIQNSMELDRYREYIRLDNKKGLEKLKYYLVKRKMDTLVLLLGCILLKWK